MLRPVEERRCLDSTDIVTVNRLAWAVPARHTHWLVDREDLETMSEYVEKALNRSIEQGSTSKLEGCIQMCQGWGETHIGADSAKTADL